MGLDSLKLANHDADIFASFRNPDSHGFFNGHADRKVVQMRTQVIHPVCQVNVLQIGLSFSHLFNAPMDVTEMRNNLKNGFTVETGKKP